MGNRVGREDDGEEDAPSSISNNGNSAIAFGDSNVDMEMGTLSSGASNSNLDLTLPANVGVSNSSSRGIEDAIPSHNILPRHLVGFEWEILGKFYK